MLRAHLPPFLLLHHRLDRLDLGQVRLPQNLVLAGAHVGLEVVQQIREIEAEERKGGLARRSLVAVSLLDHLHTLDDFLEVCRAVVVEVGHVSLQVDPEVHVGVALGRVFAVVFDACPFLEALVVEEGHEDLLLEELVVEVFEGGPVDFHARLLYLKEVILRTETHFQQLLLLFQLGIAHFRLSNWLLASHIKGLPVVYDVLLLFFRAG